MNQDRKPRCSIVIPTKNGGSLFRTVIEKLCRQTYWTDSELIVIDSGSSDETLSIAEAAKAKVVRIAPEEFNHGATRDLGISLALAETVVLMVQDAVPANPMMLEHLVTACEQEGVAGAYGRQVPYPNADVLIKRNLNNWLTGRTVREVRSIEDRASYSMLPPIEKYLLCNFDNVCSAIRKSVWREIKFGVVDFGEDIDWAERVLLNGHKIAYEPRARVFHSHERTLWYEYHRTYVCHRKLYRQFGLHLVPRLRGMWPSWRRQTALDIEYAMHRENRLGRKIRTCLSAPFFNLVSAVAQFRAVQDELRGTKRRIRNV